MFLMYVDESGDVGTQNSPTRYFILSALIVHESQWRTLSLDLMEFRKLLKKSKSIPFTTEIHATDFLKGHSRPKHQGLDILKKCIKWLTIRKEISIISVAIDKNGHTENVFELAWGKLLEKLNDILKAEKFPIDENGAVGAKECGLVIPDKTGEKLSKLLRNMQQNAGAPFMIIEDPFFKDSKRSLLNQMVDVVAYFARQLFEPNPYLKNQGGWDFYKNLLPVINNFTAEETDYPHKIVKV